jgi:hypothetical protein
MGGSVRSNIKSVIGVESSWAQCQRECQRECECRCQSRGVITFFTPSLTSQMEFDGIPCTRSPMTNGNVTPVDCNAAEAMLRKKSMVVASAEGVGESEKSECERGHSLTWTIIRRVHSTGDDGMHSIIRHGHPTILYTLLITTPCMSAHPFGSAEYHPTTRLSFSSSVLGVDLPTVTDGVFHY